MARFRDTQQREWELKITALDLARIREDCDPEFLLGVDGDEYGAKRTTLKLQRDPFVRCRILYLLCEAQLKGRDVSEEDFYLSILNESIEPATAALIEALMAFFPPRMQHFLQAFAAKMGVVQERLMADAMAKLEDPTMEDQMFAFLQGQAPAELPKTPCDSAASLPDSSASVPTTSTCAN